jgi:hypothetical protein
MGSSGMCCRWASKPPSEVSFFNFGNLHLVAVISVTGTAVAFLIGEPVWRFAGISLCLLGTATIFLLSPTSPGELRGKRAFL